ncbi:hypothetical protein [uncultured marine virus]|uniref:ATP-dependent helicase Rep n=1 Tax=uncultured marine virus TaxID=186617 RepID=S4TE64_9VIRU|nr:hypothetical protein [uncultured marine virus]
MASSSKRLKKARSFSFTWNNYTEADIARLKGIEHQYLVFGKEVGESGTPHLQGMINFKSPRSFASVMKELEGAHVEKTISSYDSMVYCKKDGDVYEHGKPPVSQKAKGDMEKARWKRTRELAAAGKIEEVDDDIYVRFYGTLKRIKEDHQQVPPAQAELNFHWFYGASGTGKSRAAYAENPNLYIKNSNKWWDGYVDQPCVLIEEWDPNLAMMASHMKKWADHHPFSGEIKGGTKMLRPPKIIVCSNYTIQECFPNEQDWKPLERRFKVRKFGEDPLSHWDAPLPTHAPGSMCPF